MGLHLLFYTYDKRGRRKSRHTERDGSFEGNYDITYLFPYSLLTTRLNSEKRYHEINRRFMTYNKNLKRMSKFRLLY